MVAWDGMVAYTSATNARGTVISKKMKVVAAGMYYVTAEKIGSVFLKTARYPFEDILEHSRRLVVFESGCLQ